MFQRLRVLIALAVMFMSLSASALIVDLPVKMVDGKPYHYYVVQPKETIYSLCIRLGISKERLTELNPQVRDGLKAGSTLLFPAQSDAAVNAVSDNAPAGVIPDVHIVAKGETLYGIARMYNLSVPQLQEWNPDALVTGIRPGMKLLLHAPTTPPAPVPSATKPSAKRVQSGADSKSADNTSTKVDKTKYITYKVRERETFYSIAHSHGLTVAELEEANPEIGILRVGDVLRIPVVAEDTAQNTPPVSTATNRTPTPAPVTTPAPQPQTETVRQPAKPTTINIALLLPLMLDSDNRSVQANRYLEFYRGMLLALDSLRTCGIPVQIQVYDTEDSDARLEALLAEPALASAQVIIAPDNERQLKRISAYARQHGINVLNLFSVRSDSYLTDPVMMQANIPHDMMYERAIEAIVSDLKDRIPVILRRHDGPADKQEFVNELCKRLTAQGIPYRVVEYTENLTVEDLPAPLAQDGTPLSFGFIPVSSRQAELNLILSAIIEYQNSVPAFEGVRLYGFPEWTAFRGETMANMHRANTFVYSRFYTVPDDPGAAAIDERYERWFGTGMTPAVPRQGLLGFDTGMFLIQSLMINGGNFDIATPAYTGVQNGFNFVRTSPGGGLVNECLYFVNFRPSGLIDRISL